MKTNQQYVLVNVSAMARHAVQFCAVLAAALLLSACKHEANVAGGVDPAGVYALIAVDGKNVPASIAHDGVAVQVRSGVFTFNPDGTCGTKTVFVPPSGAEVTREVTATYKRNGPNLTMRWKGAGVTTGTIDGDTFTMNNEGLLFVYKK